MNIHVRVVYITRGQRGGEYAMSDALILNIRKRGTPSCIEGEYQVEVAGGERIIIALERIADILEAKPKQQGELTQEEWMKLLRAEVL